MDLVEQLDHIFSPRSIAVVGASVNPEKVGFMCVANLLEVGFGGRVYPVNPGLSELFGLRVYPSVTAIPGEVDLAIVAIPAELTVSTIEECIAKGIKGAVLISGGFREVGTEIGLDLQAQLSDIASRGGMKIIGPNTLGLINPRAKLNASFQHTLGLSQVGNVGIAAQSGGTIVYLVHALTNHNVGISKAIGLGNRCNLDFDEVVTYFGQDKETEVIVLHVEGLEQPQRLINVARRVVERKPIVVYKVGRAEEMDRATLSHTGALAGKYEFYKAAFHQAGMIIAGDITELVDIAKALSLQSAAVGNRVAIFSVQAGPGIIMADKCRELGLRLAQFSSATKHRLRQLASPLNPVDNPVDLAWKAFEFDTCREMLKVVLEDDGVDAITVAAVFYGLDMEIMMAVADVADIARSLGKPITVCLDSPRGSAYAQINVLEGSHIPTFPLPERAITGLAGLIKYGEILKAGGGGGGIRTHGSV
ncbi:MAG: CoA-binding protein [Dehalococcoidia bacterium]|nr:CoA-binding protein [Dehalococcoidia bacterium]